MLYVGIGETDSSKQVEFAVVYKFVSFLVIVQTYTAHHYERLVLHEMDRNAYLLNQA